MGRPISFESIPSHPAVSGAYRKQSKYGWNTVVADVTCPACGKVRTFPLYTLRQQMKRHEYSGHCRSCMLVRARDGFSRWHKKRCDAGGARWINGAGYVMLGVSAIADADLWLFKAMGKTMSVSEHRMVMASHLRRPLESWELVDHMNGIKSDNSLNNLRLYVKGKNGPGSSCGHGTYYHEWQMALARIRELGG